MIVWQRWSSALFLAALLIPLAGHPASSSAEVDPLIGTAPNPLIKIGWAWDTGNVFPGPVYPRGMIAWSPDTTHQDRIAGGYWYPDDKIEGFSLTHFSGRGVPCLKDVVFLPVPGDAGAGASPGTDWERYASGFAHSHEHAEAGYYSVVFDNAIRSELTVTARTGLARFTFAAPISSLLLRANGDLAVHGNQVTGYAQAKVPKSKRPYRVYFAAEFNRPFRSVRTWSGDRVGSEPRATGPLSGAILGFDTGREPGVLARVGISYTSLENAQDNLARENPGWNFAAIKQAAAGAWDDKLNRVAIEGGTALERTIFYTALYHCWIHPNLLDDANGQYLGMDDRVHTVAPGHHQYQNIPAWDQHRSHTALLAILARAESSDVVQSLVNYAQQDAAARPHGGGLPRWEQINHNSGGMVGDGDDSLIATAYAFGARGFDSAGALAAMEKGASLPGTTSDGVEVRAGLSAYEAQGYVPGQAAVTLEYCGDDFSLAQFAAGLGQATRARGYLKRAQNWKNLFDPAVSYLRPKATDGRWLEPFSPAGGAGFIEGTAGQYFWMVNFNLRSLIERIGGKAAAVARLDRLLTQINGGLKTEFAYMGNETCEEIPWVYDFAGAPARTQAAVRRIERELFSAAPGGLPGNDDAGAMSSWLVFAEMGLYPEIPGVGGLVVGSPLFPRAALKLENGSTIEIIGRQSGSDRPYVQSLRINGQVWASPWIPWDKLAPGARLEFDLGPQSSAWGQDPRQTPPSFDLLDGN
jgi:predicted alpha-1,2-mannosidase